MKANGTSYDVIYTVYEREHLMYLEGDRVCDEPQGNEAYEVYIEGREASYRSLQAAVEMAFALAKESEPEAFGGEGVCVGGVRRTVYTVEGMFEDADGNFVGVDDEGDPQWDGGFPVIEAFDPARDTFPEYGEAFESAVRGYRRWLDYEDEGYGGVPRYLEPREGDRGTGERQAR